MIRFRCPKCDAQMEVDESFANRAARCPTCGHDLRVPKTGEPATPIKGVVQPTRPGVTVVKVQGKSVEIVPPMDPMALIALAAVGLSVVAAVGIGVSGFWTPPWAVGMTMGALLALLGAIIAIPAYHGIRRSRGRKRGKALATAGLAGGGVLFLVFLVGAIIGFFTVTLKPPCEENLKRIYLAIRAYADKHEGAFPKSLEVLPAEGYLDGRDWLTCPAYRVVPGTATYILTPDINVKNPLFPDSMVIVSDGPPYQAHPDGFVRALLLSGKITNVPVAEWAKYQEEQAKQWNDIQNKIRRGIQPGAPASAPPAPAGPPPAACGPGHRFNAESAENAEKNRNEFL
ncbi:MAG: zinc ribbon domain-containing protein [Planctomycetes bacterium]|nr:zinc ribbon domain-containing protein [Planctomycetota bacterium]